MSIPRHAKLKNTEIVFRQVRRSRWYDRRLKQHFGRKKS